MPAGQLRNLVPLLLALVCSVSPSAAQQKECECVPYWLCDNGRIITDGMNLLEYKRKSCPGLEVCCSLQDNATSPETELPSQGSPGGGCGGTDELIVPQGSSGAGKPCPVKSPSILGLESSEEKSTSDKTSLTASNGECVCIEFWLCDHGSVITDGNNLLEFKLKSCTGLDVCCVLPNETNVSEAPPPPDVLISSTPTSVIGPTTPDSREPLRIPTVAPGGDCGRRRFPFTANFKSGNGPPERTFYGEAPWMVVILRDQKGNQPLFSCAGTLITPNIVLTAAHCLNITAGDLLVRAGEYESRRDIKPLPVQTVRVSRVSVHPQFNMGNLQNDIALLFLESPMHLNEVVDIACGPIEDIDPNECYTTGWVLNPLFGRYQVTFSKVDLVLRDRDYCQNSFRKSRLGRYFIFHEGFVCAGGGDMRNTCMGGGGGPLVCPSKQDPNKLIQVGISAWRIGCGEGYPTVFVSTQYYLDWVSSQLT